jgi:hypothetical protein
VNDNFALKEGMAKCQTANPDGGAALEHRRGDWNNAPIVFDVKPQQFQVIYDWVAQGAQP